MKVVAAQVPLSEVEAGPDAVLFAESAQVSYARSGHTVSVAVTDQKFRNPDQIALAVASGELDTRNTNLTRFGPGGQVLGFQSKFHLIDVVADAMLDTGRPGYPLHLIADWVHNAGAVGDEKHGVWLGATYGLAEEPKTYSLNYTYASVEREAVLSPFTFDPFPGSNVRLNMLEFSYMPKPRINLDFNALFIQPLKCAHARRPAGPHGPAVEREAQLLT